MSSSEQTNLVPYNYKNITELFDRIESDEFMSMLDLSPNLTALLKNIRDDKVCSLLVNVLQRDNNLIQLVVQHLTDLQTKYADDVQLPHKMDVAFIVYHYILYQFPYPKLHQYTNSIIKNVKNSFWSQLVVPIN